MKTYEKLVNLNRPILHNSFFQLLIYISRLMVVLCVVKKLRSLALSHHGNLFSKLLTGIPPHRCPVYALEALEFQTFALRSFPVHPIPRQIK